MLWEFPLSCLCSYFPTCLKEFEFSSFVKAQDGESSESREHVVFICENCSVSRFSSPPGHPSLSRADVMARAIPPNPSRVRGLTLFLWLRGFWGRIFGPDCWFVLLWVATPRCSGFPLNAGAAPQIIQQEAVTLTLCRRGIVNVGCRRTCSWMPSARLAQGFTMISSCLPPIACVLLRPLSFSLWNSPQSRPWFSEPKPSTPASFFWQIDEQEKKSVDLISQKPAAICILTNLHDEYRIISISFLNFWLFYQCL